MSREIIDKYIIRAKKSLGQNFLIDDNALETMADSVEITDKNIVEVGPGYGALTQKIIKRGPAQLELVELDVDMIEILEHRSMLGDFDDYDFTISRGDVLKYKPPFENYNVLANIPYYITSPILRHFLYELNRSPQSMLILMQKEVADKILLGQSFVIDDDGNKNYKKPKKIKASALSLLIQKKCYVQKIIDVPKESFLPAPKVDSTSLLFIMHDEYREVGDDLFLKFLFECFTQSRKTLKRNLLIAGYDIEFISRVFSKLEYSDTIRAEQLPIEEFIKLFKEFYEKLAR